MARCCQRSDIYFKGVVARGFGHDDEVEDKVNASLVALARIRGARPRSNGIPARVQRWEYEETEGKSWMKEEDTVH